MSIKPLSEDVIRRIRSSATITCLNAVVCGLIKNALDASATRVIVTLDYSRGNCTVEDDGLGILPFEFHENGGLGRPYRSGLLMPEFVDSSRNSPESECHGAHGNFLASVAALSMLSITSHHHQHNSQNSLIIHNSKVLARNVPALPEQRLLTFSHGTRVTVRDLFGSMAVRVKQRAVASEKAAVDKEWGHLTHDVAALLLAWPSTVALHVRDTVNNNETRFRPNTASQSNILAHYSRILAQSGLMDGLDQASWTPVAASVGRLTINGCISLNPVATRRAQFISLGVQPVANEHGTNVLYTEVNRVFIKSGFAIEEGASNAGMLGDAITAKPNELPDRFSRPKRGLDRWPMYYFRISSSSRASPLLDSSLDDVRDGRNRSLADIIELLKLVCYEFLKKHHFHPHKVAASMRESSRRKQKDENVGVGWPQKDTKRSRPTSLASSRSSSVTPISRPASPFDLWQRVKAGRIPDGTGKVSLGTTPASNEYYRAEEAVSCRNHTSVESPDSQPSLRFLDDSGNLLRRPFEDMDTFASPAEDNLKEPNCTQDKYAERGSITNLAEIPARKPTKLSKRSQNAVIPANLFGQSQLNDSAVAESASVLQQAKESVSHSTKEPSGWLKDVLTNWSNPVFPPVEAPVPRLKDASLEGRDIDSWRTPVLDGDGGCSHMIHRTNIKLSGRISKAALVGAEVVSQVDRKFILVKLGRDRVREEKEAKTQAKSLLALIDQHAADERCRLEQLMQEYFQLAPESKEVVARTRVLEEPLVFEFSDKECQLLRKLSRHLHRWGLHYKLEDPALNQWRHNGKQVSKVEISGLPPSISERCRMEPRLLADLLRHEIWKAEEDGPPAVRPFAFIENCGGPEIDWVSNFHGCPQGILDLLNSRSCRSE
ncbi:DNA mismatch repair protein MLH3 [Colletotrichum chlorophyti]|uniref:DNA mismatch repair protein MLH3 n=1 Tax=Colletotrichum chlorophyti TaxID=708187 RepID=A0A1Q8RQK7_9PEZI|nr:DNA mismatch repair protein MLH3 [Colletotrichum chlorophyti]